MREYDRCDICKTFHWLNERCPDLYEIYHYDYNGDDPIKIRGNSFENAAEKYAKYYNSDDYPMNDDYDGIDIKVVNEFGESKCFNIIAEPTIYYQVTEIEEDELDLADAADEGDGNENKQ